MSWNILCRSFGGATDRPRRTASIEAWSLTDHSHSRFWRNSKDFGNTSLFSVVSIWKTRTWSLMTRPIRHAEWCIADCSWSMNEREWTIVLALWWWRSELYDASPMPTDLWPP